MRADADAERRDWTIESLVPGGDGMAVLSDGRVAFATGALPGDVIRPLGVEARRGSLRATRFELVTASPDRVRPPCPVADECGGCDWMHLGEAAQRVHKARLLRGALERTGKLRGLPSEIPVETDGGTLGYRSRTRFHLDADGRIGFHGRGGHRVVEIPECVVCRPELNAALRVLRALPRSIWMEFSEIELRSVGEGPPTALLRARVPGAVSRAALRALGAVSGVRVVIEGEEPGAAERFSLPRGSYLLVPPGVFTQINWSLNARLVETVLDGARARHATRFCDAYAGAGNFTIPLLSLGLTGVSVEKDSRAVAAARAAAREQGLPEDGFVCSGVKHELERLARRGERFDLLLLDPPRAGAADAIPAILELRPRHVAYVACDPVTLARDLAALVRGRYELRELRGFDLFPQTHHLETLVWLESRVAGESGRPA